MPAVLAALIRFAAVIAVAAFIGAVAAPAAAHDIPADVRINAFVKPQGNRLELLLRLPLASLIDADYPIRGPGYLDLARAGEAIAAGIKVWVIDNIDVYENDALLPKPDLAAFIVSLPSDKSFETFEGARAHVLGPPLPDTLDVYWTQQLLDVLLEYPIRSDASDFSIDARTERLGLSINTALRFLPPDGAVRAFDFTGAPGLIYLDPRWHQAMARFVVEGFWYILGGTDTLLFLACLVIPIRRLRALIVIVTSFTLAHSISLFASTLGFGPDALWFPPLIETLIAATIVFMALENIVGMQASKRWIYAFAFGLIHGFGFSFALREQLQFAGEHLLTALLGFNLGVEIGQLAVLAVLLPALALLFKYVLPDRMGVIILSALLAHTGWHWMLDRGAQLAKYPFPKVDVAFLIMAMRGMMAVLVLTAMVWAVSGFVRRFTQSRELLRAPALAPVPER
jgi:hypothetical protein